MAFVVADEDRIYEEIEAPKFVDFSNPERNRPDDRSWFCARIGCDRQHEEVDPDALHKSFVLRVLAARSPHVRPKKAQSRIPRCPRTAPVKSVKDRELKSVGVVSIPDRIKAHPISSLRTNPLAKTRNQAPVVTSKTPTTTPIKKQFPNGEGIPRIGRSPMVASKAALGCHTTNKKVQDATKTVGSQILVSEMCHGMKNLQIDSNTKSKDLCRKAQQGTRSSTLSSSKSNLQDGRFVPNGDEEGGFTTSKSNDDSTATDIDRKSSDRWPSDLLHGKIDAVHHLSDASKSDKRTIGGNACDRMEYETDEVVARRNNSLSQGSEKENVSACIVTKAEPKRKARVSRNRKGFRVGKHKVRMDDEKENSSEIGLSLPEGNANADHDNQEHPQKVVEARKKTTTLPRISTPVEKYDKLKATNPKPFRFRTDERGILKEANMEKKLHLDSSKETKTACAKYEKSGGASQSTITPQRRKNLENCSEPRKMMKLMTPSQKPVTTRRSGRVAEAKKASSAHRKLQSGIWNHLEEKATSSGNNKTPNSKAINTPSRLRRPPATVPRGPVFHRINMPKGCTKRLQDVLS